MNTTRNRAMVLAQFLRAAAADLRAVARRIDDEAATSRATALATIDGVAEALEEAAAKDPAGSV